MEVKSIIEVKPVFNPIKIELIIDSKEELSNLLARLYLDANEIGSHDTIEYIADQSDVVLYRHLRTLWRQL